jgi:hypothetical protein
MMMTLVDLQRVLVCSTAGASSGVFCIVSFTYFLTVSSEIEAGFSRRLVVLLPHRPLDAGLDSSRSSGISIALW